MAGRGQSLPRLQRMDYFNDIAGFNAGIARFSIKLATVRSVERFQGASATEFRFVLKTDERPYQFISQSIDDLQEWILTIRSLMDVPGGGGGVGKQPRPPAPPPGGAVNTPPRRFSSRQTGGDGGSPLSRSPLMAAAAAANTPWLYGKLSREGSEKSVLLAQAWTLPIEPPPPFSPVLDIPAVYLFRRTAGETTSLVHQRTD